MKFRRFLSALGILAVTIVAASISYRHQFELAYTHGQPPVLAAMWPGAVDGLLAATSVAISTDRAGGFRPRLWALYGFWIGVTVSVLANYLATPGGIVNHGVSAFPAIAFVIAVEALSSKPRPRKSSAPVKPAQATGAPLTPPAPGVGVPRAAAVKTLPAGEIPAPAVTVTKRVPAAAKRPPSNAQKVAKAAANSPDATAVELARRLRLSESTVRRHLTPPVPAGLPVTAGESAHVNGYSFEAAEASQ